jgi:hypothetical protein
MEHHRVAFLGDHRLTVSDEGGWRWPHAPGRRGRGTAIMQAVAARLIVDRRPQGTTLHATVTLAR